MRVIIAIVNFLNSYSGFFTLMVYLGLAVITLVYVVHTKRLAEQAKKQVSLMILSQKVAQHRELCEKVYSVLRQSFMKLYEVKDFFRNFGYFGGEEWEDFKSKLSYFVYQLDSEYMESILKINVAIDVFKSQEVKYKVKSKIQLFINDIFYKRLALDKDNIKLEKVLVRELCSVCVVQDFINLFCWDGLMKDFLRRYAEGGKVYWSLGSSSGTNKIIVLSDTGDGNSFQPLDLQIFEDIVSEIRGGIRANGEFNGWVELVRMIVGEIRGLVVNLEMELGRDDESVAKKFNICV